ncbi:MAG: gamma-glutamylcyclotransferase [Rhizobiales bacterium]|nr:gamma-glutamylcyclotransferase [Hyphomicrobiales bacterium]
MRLTKSLAALCHREVPEPSPDPRYDYFTDKDYVRAIDRILADKPEGPLWLFAYGSLIWKPEVPHSEIRRATASGWQRAFSLKLESYRGTPEQPGYMMCLDRGGGCEGAVLRLEDDDLPGQIGKLLRREIGNNEALDAVRWIAAETAEGPVSALAFYAHPHLLDYYQENRPLPEVAHGLARACGHWGSGAEYLHNTISHLEELGIHDEGLWQLQELVAREIESLYRCGAKE